MGLEVFWYIVIIASVCSYAMLDGFDLGVGCLHLFAKKDQERRVFLNSIGPVWDGNEVWLVIVVGALLAGFPEAYATLFSAFYLPLIGLIVGLIFRACAIEFRSKVTSYLWRQTWDVAFSVASILIAIAVGIALGNLIYGIPLDENHNYTGSVFLSFVHPFPLLVGVLVFALFMMHGAIFLVMKTEGELQEKIIKWVVPTTIFFIMTYAVTTMVTLIYLPHMTNHIRERPFLFVIVLANMLAIANIPRSIHKRQMGWAFCSSCLNILFLMTLFALGTFPDMIRSSVNPQTNGLTIYNSAASEQTLVVLTIIVAIGIPLVIAYGFYLYRIFHGKVYMDHSSY